MMERILRDWKAVLVFVGPALLLYAAVLIVPIIWSIAYSFFDGSPIGGFEFVGLDNYGSLVHDRDFINSLRFSARYAVVVTTGQVFLGLLLALLYVFYLKRSSALVRTLVFFPVVLPTVAVAQMFVKLFEIVPQYGLVNAVLDRFGLDTWVQPWLGQGETAFWVAAIMNIWTAMGFYAVILYAGLLDIPSEVIESARMDGAKGWSLVRFIIRPLLMPILITSLIFSLNGTLKVFDKLLALTGGGPGKLTTPLTLYMYRVAFNYNQYGYGSAVAVVLTLECLLVSLLVYPFARRDVA
jgi:raffinose/stachyose/melibiose transport system permease protein